MTGVHQIKLTDGRTYRIAYENKNQWERLLKQVRLLRDQIADQSSITNGIHSIGQFEQHVKHLTAQK